MRKRYWLVEDNLVALYIALHGYKDLDFDLEGIQEIISHKAFPMRIKNYKAIHTQGAEGLDAALKPPLYNELYDIFMDCEQAKFAKLTNRILGVKFEVNSSNDE